MAKRYSISDSDRQLLQRVISQVRRQAVEPTRTFTIPDDDTDTPERYVILTPPDGIPGMTRLGTGSWPGTGTYAFTGTGTGQDAIDCEFFPGVAVCRVFRIAEWEITPCLTEVDTLRDVYNISAEAIPGDSWRTAGKDKFGQWIVEADAGVSVSSTSGGDYDGLTRLQPLDCIQATCVETGSTVMLEYNYTTDAWESALFLSYPSGRQGKVRVYFLAGEIHCLLGVDFVGTGTHLGTGTSPEVYKELLNLHDGSYIGSALTQHVEPNGMSCAGDEFTVELTCVDCDWGGAGWYCIQGGGLDITLLNGHPCTGYGNPVVAYPNQVYCELIPDCSAIVGASTPAGVSGLLLTWQATGAHGAGYYIDYTGAGGWYLRGAFICQGNTCSDYPSGSLLQFDGGMSICGSSPGINAAFSPCFYRNVTMVAASYVPGVSFRWEALLTIYNALRVILTSPNP